MAINPAATFSSVLFQLTKAEWVALVQHHSGMSGTPPDPPMGATQYRAVSLTAWWEFKGYLASPYFTSSTTQHQLLDAHAALFSSLGAAAYLTPGVSNATRLARLVNGGCLETVNTAARGVVRGYSVKIFRSPKPSGFYKVPTLFYGGSEANINLRLSIDDPANPGNNKNVTSIAEMVAAINALPQGYRAVFVAALGFKCQLSGGEYTTGTQDGHLIGGWPGYWMDNLTTAMESTSMPQVGGVHTNIGPWLDQMIDGGVELDYWLSDQEFTFNPDDYKNKLPYYQTTDAGGVKDANGRYWYEDLYNRTITDKAAWAAEYNCPDLSPNSAAPTLLQMSAGNQTDTARHRQLCQAVFLSTRKQMRTAFDAVIRDRFPDIIWTDYDDTVLSGLWYPSVDYRKRFGGFPGPSAAASDRVGRNRYASSGDGKMRVKSGSGSALATTTSNAWAQFLHDGIGLQACIAGSRQASCCWLTPYDSYPTFRDPTPNESLALAHATMVAFAGADPWNAVWFKTDKEPSLAAQNIMATAHAAVEEALYYKIGTPLAIEPRSGWDATLPSSIEFEVLTENNEGESVIVNLTISWDGTTATTTFTERDNEVNLAPVLDALTDDTGTVSVAFSKTATATDPDSNNLAYSLVNAPTGMTINSSSGLIGWTPSAAGTFSVTVRVTDDDADNPLSDEDTFEIVVSGTPNNNAPVFDPISAGQSVNEGSLYSLQLSAEDADDDTVTFAKVSGPASLTCSSAGLVQWTPAEADGPGTYTVTVRATDDGTPNLSTDKSWTVTVNEVNVAPSLNAISDQAVDEHALLSVTPSASDTDVPSQTLTYDLTTAPTWITCNPNTGVITGTPDATMGGTVYPVTLRVRDSGTPQLSASRSFNVTVREKNTAPVLMTIGNHGASRAVPWTHACSATDADVPAQTLSWSLQGTVPTGLTIDSLGVLRWTPASNQVGQHSITVRVTDNGNDNGVSTPLYDEETFTITVANTNRPPDIAELPDFTVEALQTLTFQAAATDPDGDAVTFALSGEPSGASITSGGAFSWTPTEAQAGADYTFLVVASDSGGLADPETVTVTVSPLSVPPPVLATIANSYIAYTGEEFVLHIGATPAMPDDLLLFSLLTPVVGNMALDEEGDLRWTPARNHEGYTYLVVVQVSDQREPPNVDAVSFYITVRRPITVSGPGPAFSPALFNDGNTSRPLRRPRRVR